MINEVIQRITVVKNRNEEWPDYFVETSETWYKYTGQDFETTAENPIGEDVALPSKIQSWLVAEIRVDGESAVIQMDSKDKVVFELNFNPFSSEICSGTIVRFETREESASWEDQFQEMLILDRTKGSHKGDSTNGTGK